MAEPEDLLSRADALMARHHPERTGAEPQPEIPVLDEVVDISPEHDVLPLPNGRAGPATLDEEQIEALAASIRASLLAALQPEIDSLIEKQLTQGLAPLLERLFGELQLIARETLSDAIYTAVEQELERRKSGS
jgi:hypothetical protein